MNHEEYRSGEYYEKQEQKNAELVELTFGVLVPVCVIVCGLILIGKYIRLLLANL